MEGNESLYKYDQGSHHAQIWLKKLKHLLQNQKDNNIGLWYLALGEWALPTLLK